MNILYSSNNSKYNKPAKKASPAAILKRVGRSVPEHCFTIAKMRDAISRRDPKLCRTRTAIIVPVGAEIKYRAQFVSFEILMHCYCFLLER